MTELVEQSGLNNALEALEDPRPSKPEIPPMPDLSGTLLAGWQDATGVVHKTVKVRELNGEHEERISAAPAGNQGRYIQAILECGVESIGDTPATPQMLKDLTVGDRDYLLLLIRNATYGNEIAYHVNECPRCNQPYDVTIDLLEDVPMREFGGDREVRVALKNGSTGAFNIPSGSDQIALFDEDKLSAAEQKTLMISRCLTSIMRPDGTFDTLSAAVGTATARNFSIVDRNAILTALENAQPGPRYNEVSFDHTCGYKQSVLIGLVAMFPGL